jgi:hypothetical protein
MGSGPGQSTSASPEETIRLSPGDAGIGGLFGGEAGGDLHALAQRALGRRFKPPWPQSAAPEAPTAGAATGQSYLRDGVKTLRPSQAGV